MFIYKFQCDLEKAGIIFTQCDQKFNTLTRFFLNSEEAAGWGSVDCYWFAGF